MPNIIERQLTTTDREYTFGKYFFSINGNERDDTEENYRLYNNLISFNNVKKNALAKKQLLPRLPNLLCIKNWIDLIYVLSIQIEFRRKSYMYSMKFLS